MDNMTGKGQKAWPTIGRGTARGRPTFLTRTATDDAEQLKRRASVSDAPRPELIAEEPPQTDPERNPYQPVTENDPPPPHQHNLTRRVFGHLFEGTVDSVADRSTSRSNRRKPLPYGQMQPGALEAQPTTPSGKDRDKETRTNLPKANAPLRPVGGTDKLDTFSGVFVPTSLNVLSILMFIRFGFILGQSGVIGMLGMLVVAYLIDLVTTMSISAVASNGTVRGGGAYYLISRSLGPEFGGAIGIVSYMGFVFNTGLNAVGLIDCLVYNFGSESGNWSNIIPEGPWWEYLWSTTTVVICVLICLAGSAIFARVSGALLLVLLIATFSIPLSALLVRPFEDPKQFVEFTGFSLQTFRENLLPHFTRRAAGSQLHSRENYQDLFGILFPATCGILAGASMSGDLKNPSKSIPKGTLSGLGVTFISYTLVIISMAASITRESFYRNVNVVQDTNLSGVLILAGEIASTFFSTLMGIIGPAKQLQAIARDGVIPGLTIFGQGTSKSDDPIFAILITFVVAQLVLLLDINSIASLITMAYLMTFFALNAATFLLKVGSAPNFRPSFKYFSWATAAAGALLSVSAMFFVDGLSASGSICILLLLIAVIHYTTPPKPWGSISEVLIYHQVRKYLLRMRTEHVKFWRPQILLFVNDPRRGYKLIQFCNSLKKGGLYILGHVIVTQNFGASVPEARKHQAAWTKYIDFSRIKAFINVAISPSIEWGARNIVLSAGLGGMRPNIVVFGVYNLVQLRSEQPLVDVPSPPPERKPELRSRKKTRSRSQIKGDLPTDICYIEKRTDVQSYVMVLEDMILKLKTNVAIAAGFGELELPNTEGNTKKYIDLWPVQMTAEVDSPDEGQTGSVRTTNFDTYTLILQLGCILNTVPSWKKAYSLRVAVFVEYESDLEEERTRVTSLLESLRIKAKVLVFWLACGELKSYELIVNGEEVDAETEASVDKVLEDEAWWKDLQKYRGKLKAGDLSTADAISLADDINWGSPGFRGRRDPSLGQLSGLRKIMREPRRRSRSSFGNISNAGFSLSMRTSRIDDDMLSRHASHPSDSEYSSSSGLDGTDSEDAEDEAEDSDSDSLNMDEVSSLTKSKSKASSKKSSSRASSRKSSLKPKRGLSGSTSNLIDSPRPATIDENAPLIDFNEHVLDAPRGRSTRSRTASLESTSPKTRPASPAIEATSVTSSTEAQPAEEDEARDNSTNSAQEVEEIIAGPSIQFAEPSHPRRHQQLPIDDPTKPSIYQRSTTFPTNPYSSPNNTNPHQPPTAAAAAASTTTHPPSLATGFPSTASLPLSFNTLPSRAQHLILNELMALHSDDTAVILTTLPAPVEGTFRDEAESLAWIVNGGGGGWVGRGMRIEGQEREQRSEKLGVRLAIGA